MKTRFLCMAGAVAVITLLGACADEKKEAASTGGGTPAVTAPPRAAPTPSPSGPAPGSEGDFQASVGDTVYFDFNKSALTPDGKALLAKWADFLKKYPTDSLTIEGNCDERGTQEYNLALGDRRANAAKDFLVAQGVASSRLKTISYGKERPADPDHNEAAWAKNRRDVGVIN